MASMDVLEDVTREVIAALQHAGRSSAQLLFEIEDTLRLDGSGGALPMALSEAAEQRVVLPLSVLDHLHAVAIADEDADLREDVESLRQVAALAAA